MSRLPLLFCAALAAPLFAQSNVINGLDIRLNIDAMRYWGRLNPYPNGVNAFSLSTVSCNTGSVEVNWLEPMNSDHPYIAFLFAAERNGRIEQISDRSFIKHGFYALQDPGCTPSCRATTPDKLGIGCSDTYSTTNNGDMYYLGPPDELNPWLVQWNAVGSHFDRGEPEVAPPANTDGQRSLSRAQVNALGAVGHRVRVADADLDTSAGQKLYCYSQYVIRGERESLRTDNIGSRQFTASWTGSGWNVALTGTPIVHGSILERWAGATVTSNTNGGDDGRYYVAVKVSGPVRGLYHYEVAVHNRDNVRGTKSVRIPTCADARILNATFRDIDGAGANDWTITRNPTELVFATDGSNPLLWNEFFNFAFDSDAAPANGAYGLDQWRAGAGAARVDVTASAPLELNNLTLGPGCGTPAPVLHATGNPARATIGNASFGLALAALAPSASCYVVLSANAADLAVGFGCRLYFDPTAPFVGAGLVADASGVAAVPLPVPTDVSLEGANVFGQGFELQSGGAFAGALDFSNGLRIRIGSLLPGCPQ